MRLYSENSSPFSAPVRVAIYAKGLEIEIEPPPGGLLSAKFHAINPLGTIPCLILESGVPLPESALADLTDGGELVRHIQMGKGIQFDQIATDWKVCRRVHWQNRFAPDSFPPRALDDHVRIGGEYFDVLDIDYSLQPNHDGTTSLRVAMSYRVSTRFNWYAQPVAALLIGNFEATALRFYARRAEALAARTRATSSYPVPTNP